MNREEQAAEMAAAGLARKPAGADPEPDALTADFVDYAGKLVHGNSKEGKALRRLLPKVAAGGLTTRFLQMLEASRYFQVVHEMAKGRIEPAKGHVQLSKIVGELRKLVALDDAPDETVPANISVVVRGQLSDEDAGDPIDVANPRGDAL